MSYRVINATTLSLVDLLSDGFSTDPLLRPFFDSGLGGNMVVSPRTPQEMAENDDTGLSVWLYHIRRDPELNNLPQIRLNEDQYRPRPLPLLLHYLITPVVNDSVSYGNDPGTEQFIIGKVLQTLHECPRLSGSALRGDLVGTGATLMIRMEPLGMEEITRIWDAMERSYQLCVSYEVSMVLIASADVERTAPVKSVVFEHGVMSGRSEE